MGSLKFLFKDVRLFERRKRNAPVELDRRRPKNVKEADEHFRDALQKLNDATKPMKRAVANDAQQVVNFYTFAEICKERMPHVAMRLCRHPKHEAANGLAICNEELCPIVLGAA